ncbi:MAG: hypothetical protein ACFFDP_05505 [Promethearchaeota archaeon]
MAEIGTVKTLVLVGAIIQLLFIVYFVYQIIILPITYQYLIDLLSALPGFPSGMEALFAGLILASQIMSAVEIIFCVILAVIWLYWRKDPAMHKTGLILTGVLGLIFVGFLGGLFVLIAALLIPKEFE